MGRVNLHSPWRYDQTARLAVYSKRAVTLARHVSPISESINPAVLGLGCPTEKRGGYLSNTSPSRHPPYSPIRTDSLRHQPARQRQFSLVQRKRLGGGPPPRHPHTSVSPPWLLG